MHNTCSAKIEQKRKWYHISSATLKKKRFSSGDAIRTSRVSLSISKTNYVTHWFLFFFLAPAFEGRKEIWDALRGACYAIEQNDIDLAQSSKSVSFDSRAPFILPQFSIVPISHYHMALCWIATMSWAHAINCRFTLFLRPPISSTGNNLQSILDLISNRVPVILALQRSPPLIVNVIIMATKIRILRLHPHPP